MPAGPLWERPGKNQLLPQSNELLDGDGDDDDYVLGTSPNEARARTSCGSLGEADSAAASTPRPPARPPLASPPHSAAPAPSPAPSGGLFVLTSPLEALAAAVGRTPPSPRETAGAPTPATAHARTPAAEGGAWSAGTPAFLPSGTPTGGWNPATAAHASASAPRPSDGASRPSARSPPRAAAPGARRALEPSKPPAAAGRPRGCACLLAALLLLGAAAAATAMLLLRARGDGRPAGSWALEFAEGAQPGAPEWTAASAFWGANGGLQWFRPRNVRVRGGALALSAQPTADSPAESGAGALGLAAVLGCGRGVAQPAQPAQALEPCVEPGAQNTIQLGPACGADPLAARCNQTAGAVLPKSKGPPSMLPPAVSGMLHAGAGRASGAAIVTHGRLEIQLRLPRGDWLRPYIHLLPAPLGGAPGRPQRATDGLDVAGIRLLEGRGNIAAGCTFADGLGGGAFGARVEWGPGEAAARLGARTPTGRFSLPEAADAAVAAGALSEADAQSEWLVLSLVRSPTELRVAARPAAAPASAERPILEIELRERPLGLGGGSEGGFGRELCVTAAPAPVATCTALPPRAARGSAPGAGAGAGRQQDSAEETVSGLFDAPLALVVGLAVGSGYAQGAAPLDTTYSDPAGGEMGQDGECSKPWADGAGNAAPRFLAAQASWLPTWERPRLELAWMHFTADGPRGGGGGSRTAPAGGGAPAEPSDDAVPDNLDDEQAGMCRQCVWHRCATKVDHLCAVRNGQEVGSVPTPAERWQCMCQCCQAQCGLRDSCALTPPLGRAA